MRSMVIDEFCWVYDSEKRKYGRKASRPNFARLRGEIYRRGGGWSWMEQDEELRMRWDGIRAMCPSFV